MREADSACLRGVVSVVVLAAAIGIAGNAWAGGKPSKAKAVNASAYYNIGSIASEFLQSKTQLNILDKEDVVAPTCHEHHFVKANVVNQPTYHDVGKGVTERKWIEHWTLERCGHPVAYWVYFTEVGQGGAYVAIRNED